MTATDKRPKPLITDDNPWEVAAVNESFSKSTLNLSPHQNNEPHVLGVSEGQRSSTAYEQHHQQRPSSGWTREYNATAAAENAEQCAFTTRLYMVRFCSVLDCIVAIFGTVYAFELRNRIEPRPVTAIAVVIALAVLLFIRCTTAVLGHRCCLFISANVSAVLSLVYLLASPIAAITLNWLHPHLFATYLLQHDNLLLPVQWSLYLQQHAGKRLWLVFLLLFVVECARWQLFQTYRRSLVRDTEHWNGEGSLSESLLSSDRQGRRRPWLSWSHRRNRSPNPRDNDEDNSLFVAVQEEWASRTEEDPFWWSRDEDDIQRDLQRHSSAWAEEQGNGAADTC
jgi:hypothetical protein